MHTHTGERMECFSIHGGEIQIIMLSEIGQTLKDKLIMLIHLWEEVSFVESRMK